MYAGEQVVDVVLGEHDLRDPREVARLVLPHPQELRGRKPGKGDVGRPARQPVHTNGMVQVIYFFGGSAVIPQNGGTDHMVVLIQHHQAVHLAAAADSGHVCAVKALQQLRHTLQQGLFPVLRILLAPAGFRELQGVFLGDHIVDGALFVHQQQLHGRGAQVNSNIQLQTHHLPFLLSVYRIAPVLSLTNAHSD